MYLEHGIMTTEELRAIGHYPSEERMRKGPVAVCECLQRIPCNPCESSFAPSTPSRLVRTSQTCRSWMQTSALGAGAASPTVRDLRALCWINPIPTR